VGEYLARLPLPVWEVHLHDNSGDRDEHGHFGLGNVDFAAVAAGLKAIGFSGVSTIEIAPSFHGKTPAESKPLSAESLAQWKDMWEAG
jgi:sugar phosphate isomerase/epimerase